MRRLEEVFARVFDPRMRNTPSSGEPSSESETGSPSGIPTPPRLEVPAIAKARGFTDEQEQSYAYAVERLDRLMVRAQIPTRYRRYTWETWAGPRRPDLLAWKGQPWALIAFGPPGTGKTHVATAVFVDLLCRNWSGVWFEVSEALEEVKAEFADEVQDGRTMRALRDSPLLLLDDLGAERQTDFALDRISHVLRYRHSRELPTIITTNHGSLEELDAIDPRLSSRLGGREAIQVSLKGRKDQRL